MWLKKLKRKKMQFFIITLILLMSTAILTACISFALGVQEFVDDYYSHDRCPILFSVLTEDNGEQLLREDDKVMELIDRIDTKDAKLVSSDLYVNDSKLRNGEIIVYSLDDRFTLGYPIDVIEGEETAGPNDGEIWICNICANTNDLEVGDTIQVDHDTKDEYTISAIVSTPECSSGFFDSYPYYANSKTLESMAGVSVYPVQIYAKDASVTEKELGENLPQQFNNEVIMQLGSTLKMCLTILSTIFGGVGIAAAIIIFAVTIIIIRYMIQATLSKEFRMIGIYKAQGKSSTEIKLIYFKSYMFASVIGIVLGIFAGMPLTKYLANIILGGIKGFQMTSTTYLLSILSALVTVGLLSVNIWGQLRKIHKITPIQAMQHGMASSKEKLCKSIIPNAHSFGAIAINNLFKNKGMSILVILILTVSFYLCLMASSVGLTLGNYSNDRQIWENFPNYDGYVDYQKEEDVIPYLENSNMIDDFVRLGLDESSSKLKFEDSDLSGEESHPLVYSNFTEERYQDVPFTGGRICTNPHEITVSEDFLSRVNKKLGDYLTIECNEKQIDFLIVGTYSAMMKGGISFYIQEQDWLELGNNFIGDRILIFLKDGVTLEEFQKEFASHFTDSKVLEDFEFIANEGDTVSNIAYPICIVLFLAFTAFSVLNIINLLFTTIRENRRKYGVLKAMGFTTRYIIAENMTQLVIQCAIAIGICCILQEFVSPVLFSLACGVNYICKPLWLNALVCSSMFVMILVIALIMLLPVRKISPVELMEE